MAKFQLYVPDIDTGGAANTFITILGLKFADTTGHRGRLRRLFLGGGGGAPQDLQVSARIRVASNAGDGTSTAVNVNTIGKVDQLSVASNVAAIGETYTVEPTTYATQMHGGGSFNCRGGLLLEWAPEDAPQWGKNQTLGIEAAAGEATVARLEAFIEWEEF